MAVSALRKISENTDEQMQSKQRKEGCSNIILFCLLTDLGQTISS